MYHVKIDQGTAKISENAILGAPKSPLSILKVQIFELQRGYKHHSRYEASLGPCINAGRGATLKYLYCREKT